MAYAGLARGHITLGHGGAEDADVYPRAKAAAEQALKLEPDFWPSFYILRRAYSEKGMHKEAMDAAQRLAELDPMFGKALLVMAYVAAGQRDRALAMASGLDKNSSISLMGALVYLALGDKNMALQILEVAYKVHESTIPWLRVRGGGLDALFDEPRFQDLVRRMNLPPAGGSD